MEASIVNRVDVTNSCKKSVRSTIETTYELETEYDETCDITENSCDDETCQLTIFGSHLPRDTPTIIYLGNSGELVWKGLECSKVKLVSIPITSVTSHVELYDLTCKVTSQVFDRVTTGEVYFIGYGIGALLVLKVLANINLLEEKSRLHRLQAVFLISGIYDTAKLSLCRDSNESNSSSLSRLTESEELWMSKFRICADKVSSPLADNFDHLWKPGVRCYIFSAEKDDVCFKTQSRQMFDHLLESCDQDDMHYEVKEKVDRFEIFEQMCTANSFLARLIRYDISLSQKP